MTTKKTLADLQLSRRDFLRATGAIAGGMLISEVLPRGLCGPGAGVRRWHWPRRIPTTLR